MKIVRSWPRDVPPGRCAVLDTNEEHETLLIEKTDLNTNLAVWDLGSFLLLEWDIYVSPKDLARMQQYVEAEPEIVHVAPYLLYPPTTGLDHPVWSGRREIEGGSRWIHEMEPECELFGFGCTWLPKKVITAFHEYGVIFTDSEFSRWHSNYAKFKVPDYPWRSAVPVHWDVKVWHLHQ